MWVQLMVIWMVFDVVTGADGQATEQRPEYAVPMPKVFVGDGGAVVVAGA